MSDTATLVRRYFAIVADLGSTEDMLRAALHPDVRVIEHPNPITPGGAVRDPEGTIAGFLAGKRLLSAQRFEIHDLLADGERAAVRATWRGTVGLDTPRLPEGTQLIAHIGAFVVLAEGLVREHQTFDCYEPFG